MTLDIVKPHSRKYMKALVYAPAGHGKTVLLGTAQDDDRTYPMLLLDFEGGTEVLDGLDIDVIHIRSWQKFNEAYELLASKDHDYKSVGIDSISEVNKFAMLEILRIKGPSRNDPDLVELGDYGTINVQMRRFLRQFRDLPMHVFFAAHAKFVEDPRLKRITSPDLIPQGLSEEVCGLMTLVGYLAESDNGDGDIERLLLLHSYPKYRIKVRTPWEQEVPSEIVNPDVTEILDVLGY